LLRKTSKLLVIGHVWPQPNATAAGEHMLHLLGFFKKMHYEILFVSAAQIPNDYSCLNALDITIEIIKINDNYFDTLLLGFNPTVVLFDRFMTEEQFSWRVYKKCPDAIRVLDTEDLHFLRNKRHNILKGKSLEGLSDIAKREIASIYRSDLSLIISLKEIQLLSNKYSIPSEIITYLPLLDSGKKNTKNVTFSKRKDLIFVGNFLHQPNWDCVQYLKKTIWPILAKKLPNATLHIYGSHAAPKHLQLSNSKERFIVHGYVKNIEDELLKSKLLIAPIQFGAGQKGKLLKAMQCNLPSITTSIGAEGMVFNATWAGAIADTVTEFIEKTVVLYNNEPQWNDAQKLCHEIVEQHFNFETHFSSFKKNILKLQKNISHHRNKNTTGQILWHHNLKSTEFMSRWIMEKNKKQ